MARIAVLGAGIMGVSLALYLARRGAEVVLFDAASAPLTGASRWNEGKIHLGFLYANDPTLSSAKRLIPGGLSFAPLMTELTGRPLQKITPDDDIYLIHARSVISSQEAASYFARVSDLLREQGADYLGPLTSAAPLSRAALANVTTSDEIVAGFRTPERSLCTVTLASQLIDALASEPRVVQCMNTLVTNVTPIDSAEGAWRVHGERFDWVINALWHGRLAIDVKAGLAPVPGWSHRYRASAFIRTTRPIAAPCAVIAVGPFGDFKAYDQHTFYASWYPAGVLAAGGDIDAPAAPHLSEARKRDIAQSVAVELGARLPVVRDVFDAAANIEIEGGYVFAQGEGALDDRAATLHRRDGFGVRRRGRYVSVDTGKFSTAPWLARALAEEIAG